jgi:hypothetical protein
VATINKAIADGVDVSESLGYINGKGVDLTDSLIVSEVIISNVEKNISDSTTISDIIQSSTGYNLSIQDSVSVIEKLVKQYDLGLVESIELVDSLIKSIERPLERKTVVSKNKDRIILISKL